MKRDLTVLKKLLLTLLPIQLLERRELIKMGVLAHPRMPPKMVKIKIRVLKAKIKALKVKTKMLQLKIKKLKVKIKVMVVYDLNLYLNFHFN